MTRIAIMIGVLMALQTVSFGQWRGTTPGGDTGEYLRNPTSIANGIRGLLDPSRLHMSHSMSMSYVSLGGTGVSRGLYMNQMDYRVSDPVMLTTYLGYQFQPSGPAEWNPAATGTDFVGGADLKWRLARNTSLQLSYYRNMSPSSYSYGWGQRGFSGSGPDYWRP